MNTDPYMSTDQRSYAQKLADRITELQRENAALRDWKEQALQVESEWRPCELAAMLGSQAGDSMRKVIDAGVRKLIAENATLRAKLEPQRQKIWVLVQRGSFGDLTADVFTDPNDPIIEIRKREAGPNNYVEIHDSI